MVLIDTKGNVSNSADFVQTRETRADALAPPVESGRLEGSGEGLLGPIERLR
jgi:hypothetical protein